MNEKIMTFNDENGNKIDYAILEQKLIPYDDTKTLIKEIVKADNEVNTKEGE